MKITYIEHSCFLLEHNGIAIVTDPFCQDLDTVKRLYPRFFNPDFVVATHGHDDHIGALSSTLSDKTTFIGIVELASYASTLGAKSAFGMNIGGELRFGDVTFACVKADHSSSLDGVYLGEPTGFVIEIGGHKFYHFGDTGLFNDMKLINEFYKPDVALIPIGGRFTMDAKQASYACNDFFDFDTVIPMHYNTFPPIKTDVSTFVSNVKKGKVVPLLPLQSIEL